MGQLYLSMLSGVNQVFWVTDQLQQFNFNLDVSLITKGLAGITSIMNLALSVAAGLMDWQSPPSVDKSLGWFSCRPPSLIKKLSGFRDCQEDYSMTAGRKQPSSDGR